MEKNKNCCCSSNYHCGENCQCTEDNKCCPECTCYVQKNKELVRKFYELIASRRYDEAAALCGDDFVYYPEVHTKLQGVQAFIDLERSNMDPFGDFKMTNQFMLADEDRVAVYLTFEGELQQDNWHGVPVKNKKVYMDFMCMLRVKNGKIIEKRVKYDRYDIFKQLGVTNLPLK